MYIISNNKNIIEVENIEEIDSIKPSDIIYIESNNNGMSMTFEQFAKSLGITLGSTPKFNGNINDDSTKNTYDVWGASWDSLRPPELLNNGDGSYTIVHSQNDASLRVRIYPAEGYISYYNLVSDRQFLSASFASGASSWRSCFNEMASEVASGVNYYASAFVTTSRALSAEESPLLYFDRPVGAFFSENLASQKLTDYFISGIAVRNEDAPEGAFWGRFGFYTGGSNGVLSSDFTQSFRGGRLFRLSEVNNEKTLKSFSYTIEEIKEILDHTYSADQIQNQSEDPASDYVSIYSYHYPYVERSLPFTFTPRVSCVVEAYVKKNGFGDSLAKSWSI